MRFQPRNLGGSWLKSPCFFWGGPERAATNPCPKNGAPRRAPARNPLDGVNFPPQKTKRSQTQTTHQRRPTSNISWWYLITPKHALQPLPISLWHPSQPFLQCCRVECGVDTFLLLHMGHFPASAVPAIAPFTAVAVFPGKHDANDQIVFLGNQTWQWNNYIHN